VSLDQGQHDLLHVERFEDPGAAEREPPRRIVAGQTNEDPAVEPPGGIRRKSREQKRDEARERDRLHRETRGFKERLAAIENEIAALEVRLKEVQIALSDPGLYKDGEKTRDVSRAHKEIQERIAWLYDEWAHLEEAIARLGSPGQGG